MTDQADRLDDILVDLDKIIGLLGSARRQRASSDDKIIAEHIDDAYVIACSMRKVFKQEADAALNVQSHHQERA